MYDIEMWILDIADLRDLSLAICIIMGQIKKSGGENASSLSRARERVYLNYHGTPPESVLIGVESTRKRIPFNVIRHSSFCSFFKQL